MGRRPEATHFGVGDAAPGAGKDLARSRGACFDLRRGWYRPVAAQVALMEREALDHDVVGPMRAVLTCKVLKQSLGLFQVKRIAALSDPP